MSSIPTKEISGDVAVGRNVHIGGESIIRGSVTVGHHLRVMGWVDAPNIKGPLKGLFGSEAALRDAYPRPERGWFALVGNTLPADVWIAVTAEESASMPTHETGSMGISLGASGMDSFGVSLGSPGRVIWMPTGEQGGELNLYLEGYESRLSDAEQRIGESEAGLEHLGEELTDTNARIEEAVEDCGKHRVKSLRLDLTAEHGTLSAVTETGTIPVGLPAADFENAGLMTAEDKTNLGDALGTARIALQQANGAKEKAEEARETATEAQTLAEALERCRGKAGGLAELDDDGIVSRFKLPLTVIEFDGFADGLLSDGGAEGLRPDPGHRVVYDRSRLAFVATVGERHCFVIWDALGTYGSYNGLGATPYRQAIYWDGAQAYVFRDGDLRPMISGTSGAGDLMGSEDARAMAVEILLEAEKDKG